MTHGYRSKTCQSHGENKNGWCKDNVCNREVLIYPHIDIEISGMWLFSRYSPIFANLLIVKMIWNFRNDGVCVCFTVDLVFNDIYQLHIDNNMYSSWL